MSLSAAALLHTGDLASADGHDRRDHLRGGSIQHTHQCAHKLLLHVTRNRDLRQHCGLEICHQDNRDRGLVYTQSDQSTLSCISTCSTSLSMAVIKRNRGLPDIIQSFKPQALRLPVFKKQTIAEQIDCAHYKFLQCQTRQGRFRHLSLEGCQYS